MPHDGRTVAAFIALVLIGGTNFVAVSVSNQELPPVYGAALRFTLASLCFLALARMRRTPFPRGRPAAGAALYGVLGVGVAYAPVYYALVRLSAGMVAVIMAAVPLFTLLFAVIAGQERPTLRGVFAAVLALTGIAVLSWGRIGGDLEWSYLFAALMGPVAVAASSVIAKSLRDVDALAMNAIGLTAGTAVLALTSLALGEPWTLPNATRTILSVAWLVLLGSVGLFQLYLYIIKRWSASATVYAITAMPLVAVLLGALILDQPITAQTVAGGALVIAAVYVGAIAPQRKRPPPVAAGGLFHRA